MEGRQPRILCSSPFCILPAKIRSIPLSQETYFREGQEQPRILSLLSVLGVLKKLTELISWSLIVLFDSATDTIISDLTWTFMGSLIDSLLFISWYESSFSRSLFDPFSSWADTAKELLDGVFSPNSIHVLFGQNLDLEFWSGDCLAPAPTGTASLSPLPRKCRQSFGIAGAHITKITPVCSRAADQTLFCWS